MIIDFKIAFQQYRETFVGTGGVVPEFSSLSTFFYDRWAGGGEPTIEHVDTECEDLWCNAKECVTDRFGTHQAKQRADAEQSIKSVLEEYEMHKSGASREAVAFKNTMNEQNLTILLPGVVPGFVLRSRKWGNYDSCSSNRCLLLCSSG
jgi:hypothetical protein